MVITMFSDRCFQKWIGQGKRTCANCRNKIQANMTSQPPINSALVMANQLVLEEKEEKIAPGTLLIELSSGDGKMLVGARHYNKDGSVNNWYSPHVLHNLLSSKDFLLCC